MTFPGSSPKRPRVAPRRPVSRLAGRPYVTGKGVTIGGLVTAVLGLLLGGATIGGVAIGLNNDKAANRIEKELQKVRDQLPTQVPTPNSNG